VLIAQKNSAKIAAIIMEYVIRKLVYAIALKHSKEKVVKLEFVNITAPQMEPAPRKPKSAYVIKVSQVQTAQKKSVSIIVMETDSAIMESATADQDSKVRIYFLIN